MMMCLGVFLFGSNLIGTQWASWTSWKSISFTRLGEFSFIICSNKFSTSSSCSFPLGTPMNLMLECLKLSHSFLSISSCFWILVSSFCFGWMFISSFCSKLLIWVPISFPSLLVPCIFCFFSLWVAFSSYFILQLRAISSVSILITCVLNSASNRLSISLSLCSFPGVFICSFIWVIFICLDAPVMLWRGGTLGIHQGKATLFAPLLCCLWGKGQRGNNAACLFCCTPLSNKLMWHCEFFPLWQPLK